MGHKIYPLTDYVNLGVWLLRMTHRLIITNICAKLFQIPFINDKVKDRTRKCDGRTYSQNGTNVTFPFIFLAIFSHTRLKKDTQVKTEWIGSKRVYCYPLVSKSHKYLWVCTDGETDGTYFYIPLFSSKRPGTIKPQGSKLTPPNGIEVDSSIPSQVNVCFPSLFLSSFY
jgi:hypothetical protein